MYNDHLLIKDVNIILSNKQVQSNTIFNNINHRTNKLFEIEQNKCFHNLGEEESHVRISNQFYVSQLTVLILLLK